MRLLLPALLLAAPVTGCAALEGSDDDDLRVAAAFYPLAWVTEEVSGGAVDLLTTPGAEPHDLELTIKETALVARADLVVYESGFQPAVDAAVESTAEGVALDAAEAVPLMTLTEEADEHAEEEHDHGEGDLDPHFWLDPLLMADLGDAVAEELVGIDPAGREDYLANAEDLRTRMVELDEAYTDGLAECERDTVVVSHDAFGYLEKYGLRFEPIAGLSPGAEPTPAHLARLQELARTEGLTTVFAETLSTTKLADTLAGDLGLATATLDPIEGVESGSGDDYVSLMRRNLDELRKANGC